MPGVVESVLGLVGLVSVYSDWVEYHVRYTAHHSVAAGNVVRADIHRQALRKNYTHVKTTHAFCFGFLCFESQFFLPNLSQNDCLFVGWLLNVPATG